MIYSIFSLFWVASWLVVLWQGGLFQALDHKTVELMIWFGLGAVGVFLLTSSLSFIRIANYQRWVWIARMYLAINIIASILAVILSNWNTIFFLFLLILGIIICFFFYEFSDERLNQAGRYNNTWRGQPHRNFFVGLILPVLMAITLFFTPDLWELKSAENIAWAKTLKPIQFKGQVIIPIHSKDDGEKLIDYLYVKNGNKKIKIVEYDYLIREHFPITKTKHPQVKDKGPLDFLHFTYDGTKYQEPLYFFSGDKEIGLKIEKR
ncbi:MAG: hypothetical protein V1865_01840 [bacterium]